jgi:hypothetical protein
MPEDTLPIVKALFRLRDAPFDPDEVTRRLGLEPTRTYRAGEPIARGIGSQRGDGWLIQVGPCETLEIAPILRELRDRVAVAPSLVREVCADLGLTPAIYCSIELTSRLAPSAAIPPDTIAWVAELGGAIDMDLLTWSVVITSPEDDDD